VANELNQADESWFFKIKIGGCP